MPDREFDKLIKDKFEDAEIEPSANLWDNISQQLEPKQKRVLPIFWIAAASVVLAITSMLVFQKTETIRLQGVSEVADVTKPVGELEPSAGEEVNITTTAPVAASQVVSGRLTSASKNRGSVQEIEGATYANSSKNLQDGVQPNIASTRLPIKQQEVKPLDVLPATEARVENPIFIAQVETKPDVNENVISENGSERRGIRNVGDLVNFVVEKVDKRDKKLVRFNTDDDDNSSIVGINIGFLKFNKKDK